MELASPIANGWRIFTMRLMREGGIDVDIGLRHGAELAEIPTWMTRVGGWGSSCISCGRGEV